MTTETGGYRDDPPPGGFLVGGPPGAFSGPSKTFQCGLGGLQESSKRASQGLQSIN